MGHLCYLYESGLGPARDDVAARDWCEKAAAKGDTRAMNNLGKLYTQGGNDVAQDYAKAREWFERAAARGDAIAKMELEWLSIREAESAGRYAVALQRQEALAAKVEAEEVKRGGKPGLQTSWELNQVIWYALFAKEFTKALTVADRSHALFPDDLSIESKRAHVLMFIGQDEEAKALYLAHKGKVSEWSGGKLWEQIVTDDFAKLGKAGLTHPMMADIEKELGVSP